MAKSRIRGGKRLDAFLRQAKAAQGVSAVAVGFFPGDNNEDGIPATLIAGLNEFGTDGRDGAGAIPERPAFRSAIRPIGTAALTVLRSEVNPRTMVVDRRTADLVGEVGQRTLRRSYVSLRNPANAPSTLALKSGDNPLIDSGFLESAITWRVVD